MCTQTHTHTHTLTGAIVGIVLGVIAGLVIIIGIVIVLAVIGYKLRVGRWFKVQKREGDEFTVDFERDLLMEDKPKRKTSLKKTGKVYPCKMKLV